MSDLFSVVLPDNLYTVNPTKLFTDLEYMLNSDVREWLSERGTEHEDWVTDSSMTIKIGQFKRFAYVAFVDEILALEFKLRWL